MISNDMLTFLDDLDSLTNEELVQFLQPLVDKLAMRDCLRIRVQHADILSLAKAVPLVTDRTSSLLDADVSPNDHAVLVLDMEVPMFIHGD